MSVTTVKAARQLGEAMTVLVNAGLTDSFSGLCGCMNGVLEGNTPEREAVLASFKPDSRKE